MKSLPFAVLLLSLTFLSSINNGVSLNQNLGILTPEAIGGGDEDGVVPWGSGRSVLEGNNIGGGETEYNSSLVLAAKRTRRKDPTDDLKYYKGGWNITEQHYFFSVAYTASPLVFIAAIWFVGFGLSSLLFCLCCCCCPRRRLGYSRIAYALSLILLILFTVAAIVGCILLYTGQGKFFSKTSDTLDYVVNQAEVTVQNIKNVSGYLDAAKHVAVNQVTLPQSIQNTIGKVERGLNSSATTLDREVKKNRNRIQDILDSVRLILVVVAAVMLVLAFLGFIFSLLGWQFLVYLLVTVGWILVAVTFILTGVFLVLHNVVGDTCVAMDEWVQNPTAHTALDDIIPCVDSSTAQETLSASKDVTFQLAVIVNGIITNVSNINVPPNLKPLYFNQSGPLVPLLCNPYNPDKSNRTCTAAEVNLNNATEVWKSYVCQVSKDNICTTVGRLTPEMYKQMTDTVTVSFGLYHYGPFLVGLLDCSFLRDTFTGINKDYCGGLRLYSRLIFIGFAMVSAAVMLSVIFWLVYAREKRHRKYTKLAKAASAEDPSAGRRT